MSKRLYVRGPLHVRFAARVRWTPTCWYWTGAHITGYGLLTHAGEKALMAHRFSYELHKGPIPDGYQIDHLCRNRGCVNPDHLEAVTQQENNRRSLSFSAVNAAKTRCKRGHPFDEANTYLRSEKSNGVRECRACHRDQERARLIRVRQAA